MKTVVIKGKELSDGVKFKVRRDGEIKYYKFDFKNYFYILYDDLPHAERIINRFVSNIEFTTDKNFVQYCKLILDDNKKREYLNTILKNRSIETFEGDISAEKRFLIDRPDFELNQDGLKIAWLDIETFDLNGFLKDEENDKIVPAFPILSIAVKEYFKDKDGEEWYIRNEGLDSAFFEPYKKARMKSLENPDNIELKKKLSKFDNLIIENLEKGEKEMLQKYYDYVKDRYDVFAAWNGNGFDHPYIIERMEKYGMNYYNLMNNNADYMEIYKKNNFEPRRSFSLNNISKVELQNSKEVLEHQEEIQKIDWRSKTKAKKYFDLFLLYPELHREYNIQDVRLMDMIEKKLNYFNIHFVQSKLGHCYFYETLHNSLLCDMLMLNENKKHNIISKSKPSYSEKQLRMEEEVPPGGFVMSRIPGLHWNTKVYDFKSFYPCTMVTFNISPETYLREVKPDLSKVFRKIEIQYIEFCIRIAKKFVDKNDVLNKTKYENVIEKARIKVGLEFTMTDLMWKFVKNYDNNIEVDENEVFTPADLNYDTRGWHLHPHFVFDNSDEGVFPKIARTFLEERDKVKYEMKNIDKNSFKYAEMFDYQHGLKININALYGFSGFKGSRVYKYEIPTAITSSCRYTLKRSIQYALNKGYEVIYSDTDSLGIKDDDKKIDSKQLDYEYFDFFKGYIKKFNTNCSVQLFNPLTKEKEICNHFLVLEHEKDFDGLIYVKKKRYYHMIDGKVESTGGYMKRSDTNPLGSEIQEKLLYDIFSKNFSKEIWKDRFEEYASIVYDYKLDEKYLIKSSSVSKPINNYGKPVIDGKTGIQKLRKSDNKPMFSPVPAHIKIAKELINNGENINVGDKVEYIVLNEKPRIEPISPEQFRIDKKYCAEYYWKRIIKPSIEILKLAYPSLVYDYFGSCWRMSSKKIEREIRKLDED